MENLIGKGQNDVVLENIARLESIGECAETAEQRVIDGHKIEGVGEIERERAE